MKSPVYVCGKIKGDMNHTNWSRHLDSCKKKRKLNGTESIFKYFKTDHASIVSNPRATLISTTSKYCLKYTSKY